MAENFYTLLCSNGLREATFNRAAVDFIFETIEETGVEQAKELFNAVMEESTQVVKPDERMMKEIQNATRNDPKHGDRRWVNIVEYSGNSAFCISVAPESVEKVMSIISKHGLTPNLWFVEGTCPK